MRCWVICFIIFLSASSAPCVTPSEVQESLAKAKAWLYQQQKNGRWDGYVSHVHGNQTGGHTALAVCALLAAGESHQEPRIAPAIEKLKKAEMTGVYALALRAQVWSYLPRTNDVKQLIARDANALRAMLKLKGPGRGFFDYNPAGNSYSHSRGNYGVLGLWALAQSGIDVPQDVWKIVEDGWLKHQHSSGGWTYKAPEETNHPVTPGMTAAGVATLFITQDYLAANRGVDCRPVPPTPAGAAIDRGMQWLVDNFGKVATDERYDRDWPYPTLYAVERVGVASGRRYFGNIDWYQHGADWLLKSQNKNGAWSDASRSSGNLSDTCFAMLFLARGRAPVVINKLDYADGNAKVNWNARPRDVANLTRWIGGAIERELNWQIVNLSASVSDWNDAPVLYIAGKEAIQLTDEQEHKLRGYIENGGLVLASADCQGPAFTTSVRTLGKALFPAYTFRELPIDHPVYTLQQFSRDKWTSKPGVLGLSNGVRELILLLPQADMGRPLQLNNVKARQELWQLGANVVLYAVDKKNLRYRGESSLVALDEQVKTQQSLKLLRIQYDGNWDPEPGGWRRLANLLHNLEKIDLQIESAALGEKKFTDAPIAHLTGTAAFQLTPEQQQEVKDFIDGGGTLIVDAAGGSSEFATSAEQLIKSLFPDSELKRLEPEHKLFSKRGGELTVDYRPFARLRLLGIDDAPRIQGIEKDGRPLILYSREDLSAGLVGQDVDGIIGYTPVTATELMLRILMNISEQK